MTTRLYVRPGQRRDWEAICDVGREHLTKVIENLQGQPDQIIPPSEFRTTLETLLPADKARILSRQLFTLVSLRRERGLSADEVIQSLTDGLSAELWTDERLKAWDEIAPLIKQLLSLGVVNVVAKALDLNFDHANLLLKTRILTDIRPVFDEKHTAIIGAIVGQTLRLTYHSADGHHSLSFAMDEKDIELLQDSCKVALAKAHEAKRLMTDSCKVKTFISGEDVYDSD